MPVQTHTDYLLQVSGAGLIAVPGVWVRLLNNSTATNYYSTAVTTSTGAFTHSAVPGDYSAFYGTAATVPGTPTLANAHWAVPVTAGDDAVLGSATLVASSPYAPSALAYPGGMVHKKTVWLGGSTGADDAMIQAAITSLNGGGRIVLDDIYTLTSGNLSLASSKDLMFEGAGDIFIGANATGIINNSANDMFSVTGTCPRVTFRNVGLRGTVGSGHLFSAGASIDSYWLFDNVYFECYNPAKSAWNQTTSGNNFEGFHFTTCTFDASATASVPFINVINDNGGAVGNTWRRCLFNCYGYYPIWLESTNAATYTRDNKFEDLIFEIPNGGCVKLVGAQSASFDNVKTYDITTTTRDLFVISKGSGPIPRYITFKDLQRRGGTLGGGLADISITEGTNIILESCDNTTLGGFTVNAAAGVSGIITINTGVTGGGITWL